MLCPSIFRALTCTPCCMHATQASVVHEPGALATGLLDLPDHLLGLVFAQLQWDAPSRHALYSSCRALRQSPSINEALSSNTMCLKVEEEGDHEHEGEDDGGLQQMLSQLETWPRYAPIKAVEVRVTDPEGTSILQVMLLRDAGGRAQF